MYCCWQLFFSKFIKALNYIYDLAVLYSGTVGSENMDSMEVPGEDFIPLTILRTTIPPPPPPASMSLICVSVYTSFIPFYRTRYKEGVLFIVELLYLVTPEKPGLTDHSPQVSVAFFTIYSTNSGVSHFSSLDSDCSLCLIWTGHPAQVSLPLA